MKHYRVQITEKALIDMEAARSKSIVDFLQRQGEKVKELPEELLRSQVTRTSVTQSLNTL